MNSDEVVNEVRAQVELDRDLRGQARLEISVDNMLVQCQRLLNKYHGSPMPMIEAFHEELKHFKRVFYTARMTEAERWQYRAIVEVDTASVASTVELISSDDEPMPQPNWQRPPLRRS